MACSVITGKHRDWAKKSGLSAEFMHQLDQMYINQDPFGREAQSITELLSIPRLKAIHDKAKRLGKESRGAKRARIGRSMAQTAIQQTTQARNQVQEQAQRQTAPQSRLAQQEQAPTDINEYADWMQQRFGHPITKVESLADVTNKTAREKILNDQRNGTHKTKGWYDPETRSVHVYMPNVTSIDDMGRTLLHELRGHGGLRAMFGEQNVRSAMNTIFPHLPADIQARLRKDAAKYYRNNLSVAVEEYLSEVAEKDESPTWWDKVKAVINNLLRRAGFNVRMTDSDIKYLLWKGERALARSDGKARKAIEQTRERLENNAIEERRQRAERILAGVKGQKMAGMEYDVSRTDYDEDYMDMDVDMDQALDFSMPFRVGNKRRQEWERIIAKRRPDLSKEEVDALFDYLDTLDNAKLEKAAFHWFVKGTIRLPEDMYKVEEAIDVADRHKANFLNYASPMELLEAFANRKKKEKPINPDDVPTLTNKKELGNGLVIYDVEESEESRRNMRAIIDTHWGKDANPWCLLAKDRKTGEFYKDSRKLWFNYYNAYQKQVAFKDGKLQAFSANSSKNVLWWDRMDKSHENAVPVAGKVPGDTLDRTATLEYSTETGNLVGATNIHKGNEKDGEYTEWYSLNGPMKYHARKKNGEFDGAVERWYENGNLESREYYKDGKLNGLFEHWAEDGTLLLHEEHKNGKNAGRYVEYYKNGNIKTEGQYDEYGHRSGTWTKYRENGTRMEATEFSHGMENGIRAIYDSNDDFLSAEKYKNGNRIYNDGVNETYFSDGTLYQRAEYKNGVLDGHFEEWRPGGQKAEDSYYNHGRKIASERWHNGMLLELANENEKREYYRHGQVRYIERGENGIVRTREWFYGGRGGVAARITYNKNGGILHEEYYAQDGSLTGTVTWNGNRLVDEHYYDKNGNEIPADKGTEEINAFMEWLNDPEYYESDDAGDFDEPDWDALYEAEIKALQARQNGQQNESNVIPQRLEPLDDEDLPFRIDRSDEFMEPLFREDRDETAPVQEPFSVEKRHRAWARGTDLSPEFMAQLDEQYAQSHDGKHAESRDELLKEYRLKDAYQHARKLKAKYESLLESNLKKLPGEESQWSAQDDIYAEVDKLNNISKETREIIKEEITGRLSRDYERSRFNIGEGVTIDPNAEIFQGCANTPTSVKLGLDRNGSPVFQVRSPYDEAGNTKVSVTYNFSTKEWTAFNQNGMVEKTSRIVDRTIPKAIRTALKAGMTFDRLYGMLQPMVISEHRNESRQGNNTTRATLGQTSNTQYGNEGENRGESLQGGRNQQGATRVAPRVQKGTDQGTGRTGSPRAGTGNGLRLERAERVRKEWLACADPATSSRCNAVVNNITNNLKNAWGQKNAQLEKEVKIPSQGLRPANAQEFHSALVKARQENPNGWMVGIHTVDEYKGCMCILSEDGKAGVAITRDGDMVSGFNSSREKGMMNLLFPMAVALGGSKGDCYITNSSFSLAKMYSRYGYKFVNKIPFSEEIALEENGKMYEEWKKKNPDAIPKYIGTAYLIADSGTSIIENYNPSPDMGFLQDGRLPEMDYEEAMQDRDRKLSEIQAAIQSQAATQETKETRIQNTTNTFFGGRVKATPVTKIISGYQTGVDTIGLYVAQGLGIETGGTAPKEFLSERNSGKRNPSDVVEPGKSIADGGFGLHEISAAQQEGYEKRHGKPNNSYTPRTEANVMDSDGTVYFATDANSPGRKATERFANEHKKPFIFNPNAQKLRQWIIQNNIKTLNVAGNRGSKLTDIQKRNIAALLRDALSDPAQGQTGAQIQPQAQQQQAQQKAQQPQARSLQSLIAPEQQAQGIEGINIASRSYSDDALGQQLTNTGNELGFTYEGVEYHNVEHAYQTLKSGSFDEGYYNLNKNKSFPNKNWRRKIDTSTNFQLMVNLIKAKLLAHPELITAIAARGGEEFIRKSTHIVNGRQGDYWESTGGNNFINALTEAYAAVAPNAINRGQDTLTNNTDTQVQAQPIEAPTDSEDISRAINTTNAVNNNPSTGYARLLEMGLDAVNIMDMALALDDKFEILVTNALDDKIEELQAELEKAKQLGIRQITADIAEHLANLRDEDRQRTEVIKLMGGIAYFYDELKKWAKERTTFDDDDFVDLANGDEKYAPRLRKIWEIMSGDEAFDLLFAEAVPYINDSNAISIYYSKGDRQKAGTKEGSILGVVDESTQSKEINDKEFNPDDEPNRTSGTDGWTFNARYADPVKTARGIVKRALSDIIDIDENGIDVMNSIGTRRRRQELYMHMVLVDECAKGIRYADDFSYFDENMKLHLPLFEKLVDEYPWIQQLISEMTNGTRSGEMLATAFYNDMRKDKINWAVINPKNGRPIIVNDATSAKAAYVTARNKYDLGIDYEHAMWDANRRPNKNIGLMWSLAKSLTDEVVDIFLNDANPRGQADLLAAITTPVNDKFEEDENGIDIIDRVIGTLGLLGYTVTRSKMTSLITNSIMRGTALNDPMTPGIKLTNANPFIYLMQRATDVLYTVKNAGERDLFDLAHANMMNIANVIGSVSENFTTSTIRESGKLLQCYAAPSKLDTIVKRMTDEDIDRARRFIEGEYGPDDFFWHINPQTGEKEYDLEWVRLFLEGLADPKKGYTDLQLCEINMIKDDKRFVPEGSRDYVNATYEDMICLSVSMFFHDREDGSDYFGIGYRPTAWYMAPIYSDSPACNCIKAIKYIVDPPKTYIDRKTGRLVGHMDINYDIDDIMLPLFRKLVFQELRRIKKVQERRKRNVKKIQNYDMRGGKFCFIPQLNNYEFDDGVKFMDAYKAAKDEGDMDRVNEVIDTALRNILHDGFDRFMKDLKDRNLFDPADENATGETQLDVKRVSAILDKRGAYDSGVADDYGNCPCECKIHRLYEYYLNTAFATSQIIQLTTTDLAYYKDITEFQKRFKQVHSSGQRFNTNSRYGKKHQKSVYIADRYVVSSTYTGIKASLQKAVKQHRMSEEDMKDFLKEFEKICSTDGQAYRSPKSIMSLLDMLARLTPELEAAFERFRNGTYDAADMRLALNTIKPFLYATPNRPDGLWNSDGTTGYNRTPVQHKDSEMPLLNAFQVFGALIYGSQRLRGISNFMEKNDIDVCLFPSACKVGLQGSIDINSSPTKVAKAIQDREFITNGHRYTTNGGKDFDQIMHGYVDEETNEEVDGFDQAYISGEFDDADYEAILKYFEPTAEEVEEILTRHATQAINIGKDENGEDAYVDVLVQEGNKTYNTTYVTITDTEDYMVAQPTPNHLVDTECIIGSQMKNLVQTSLPSVIQVSRDEKGNVTEEMSKEDVIAEMQALMTENILEDYAKVEGDFANIEKLQKRLKRLVQASGDKYGKDMANAFEIVERNGRKVFNLPLSSPQAFHKTMELVLSTFKKRISRQYTKGGTAYIASAFGYNDLKVNRDEKTGRIISVDCYLPAFAREFYQHCMKDVLNEKGEVIGQEVDMAKVPRELREFVGYRNPTAAKAQMVPLNIKGFLPAQMGGVIIMPDDIVAHAGSDFDIDKLYLMFHEFRARRKHDMKKAWSDFFEAHTGLRDAVRKKTIQQKDLKEEFDKWFNPKKEQYYTETKLEKIKYEHKKKADGSIDYIGSPQANTREARNNRLIDLIRGVLTSEGTDTEFNCPTTFQRVVDAGYFQMVLKDKRMLAEWKRRKGMDPNAPLTGKDLKELMDDKKTVNELAEEYKTEIDPLAPNTFATFHERNMIGKALIARFAVQAASHAKMQNHGFGIKPEYQITVNGRVLKELDREWIIDPDDIPGIADPEMRIMQRVSQNISQIQESTVDNGKKPVLYLVGLNNKTAPIGALMVRMRITIPEMSLFFNHPQIKEIVDAWTSGMDFGDIQNGIEDRVKELHKAGIWSKNIPNCPEIKTMDMLNRLADHINVQDKSDEEKKRSLEAHEITDLQYANLFIRLKKMADKLGAFVRVTRADSPNGAVEPDLAKAMNQKHELIRVLEDANNPDYPFTGVTETILADYLVERDGKIMGIDEMRTRLLQSPMPMLQAFTSLGVEHATRLIQGYFIQTLPQVTALVDRLRSDIGTVSDGMLSKVYDAVIAYVLSTTELFGSMPNATYAEKRKYFNKQCASELLRLMKNNPELTELGVMRRIAVRDNGSLQIAEGATIKGKLLEFFMHDLERLQDMKKPDGTLNTDARKIAMLLFAYCYYNDCFKFGPNEFGNFFSSVFISRIDEFTNALDPNNPRLQKNGFWERFDDQLHANYPADLAKGIIAQKAGTQAVNNNGRPLPRYTISGANNDIVAFDKTLRNGMGEPYRWIKLMVNRKLLLCKYDAGASEQQGVSIYTIQVAKANGRSSFAFDANFDSDALMRQVNNSKEATRARADVVREAEEGEYADFEEVEEGTLKNDGTTPQGTETPANILNDEDADNDPEALDPRDAANLSPDTETGPLEQGKNEHEEIIDKTMKDLNQNKCPKP